MKTNALFLLFTVMSSAHALDCNPSFMVCPNEDGTFHFNQVPVSYQKPINLVVEQYDGARLPSKKHEKAVRSAQAKDYIQVCLPKEYHGIMSKIVAHESGANQYAIGVNGGYGQFKQPSSLSEAVSLANALMREGRSFDMGFAQINSQHLKPNGFLSKLGITVDDIFEPCVNLRAGANIYGNAAIKNGGDVKVALSIYNTGTKSNGISNGYVQKVLGSNL
jgi:type IV secretion system protein VirB1